MIAYLMAAAATFAQPLLQPWSYFVGHCWVGPAPGNRGEDRHCFESVFGGQHVRDRHDVTVNGRKVYEGETLYSVHGPKVVFTYWNSLGGLGTGSATASGDQFHFSGTIHATPASEEEPMDAAWRKVDGGYKVQNAEEKEPRLFQRAD